MITIDVKVYGGISPLPIRVFIDNIRSFDDIRFTRNESFTQSFDLPTGEYYIIISGGNPIDGKTVATITGKGENNTDLDMSKTKTGDLYSAIFYVKI